MTFLRGLTWVEAAAVGEGISGESRRTGAHREVAAGVADGVGPTRAGAGVDAAAAAARKVIPTLGVVQALGSLAEAEGIPQVSAEAGADGASPDHRALGVLAARVALAGGNIGHGCEL